MPKISNVVSGSQFLLSTELLWKSEPSDPHAKMSMRFAPQEIASGSPCIAYPGEIDVQLDHPVLFKDRCHNAASPPRTKTSRQPEHVETAIGLDVQQPPRFSKP